MKIHCQRSTFRSSAHYLLNSPPFYLNSIIISQEWRKVHRKVLANPNCRLFVYLLIISTDEPQTEEKVGVWESTKNILLNEAPNDQMLEFTGKYECDGWDQLDNVQSLPISRQLMFYRDAIFFPLPTFFIKGTSGHFNAAKKLWNGPRDTQGLAQLGRGKERKWEGRKGGKGWKKGKK